MIKLGNSLSDVSFSANLSAYSVKRKLAYDNLFPIYWHSRDSQLHHKKEYLEILTNTKLTSRKSAIGHGEHLITIIVR